LTSKKAESSSDSDSEDSSEEEKPRKKRTADQIEAAAPAAKKQKTDNGHVATGATSTAPVAEGENSDDPKVFIGNLSFQIDDDAIRETFKDCGEIVKIDWFTDKMTQKFKGCGLLEFSSPAEAIKATALHDIVVLGRPMVVRRNSKPVETRPPRGGRGDRGSRGGRDQQGPSEKPAGCNTVFLGNLSFEITEDDVKETFGECGTISDIRWVEKEGVFKGIAFVQFEETEATDKAVAKAGTNVKGRPIKVDFAKSSSRN